MINTNIIFNSPEQQTFFQENGYVKVSIISEEEVADLIHFHNQNNIAIGDGFSTVVASNDSDLKLRVKEKVLSVFLPKLNQLLFEFKPIIATYLCKSKNSNYHVDLHQDWSFVDENKGYISVNMWCPLVETNATNGALSALPKSHLLPRYPRVAPASHCFDREILEGYKKFIVEIPTKLGEAIFFDNALFHSSGPNLTENDRLVVGLLSIPKKLDGILYYISGAQTVDEYLTDEHFFINHNPFTDNSGKYVKTISGVNEQVVYDKMIELFGELELQKENQIKKSFWKRLLPF